MNSYNLYLLIVVLVNYFTFVDIADVSDGDMNRVIDIVRQVIDEPINEYDEVFIKGVISGIVIYNELKICDK